MMKYVLKLMDATHKDNGKFVARDGLEKSYTSKIDDMRIYSSYENAADNACGNEVVIALADI